MTFKLFNSKLYWFDNYQNEDNIMTEEFKQLHFRQEENIVDNIFIISQIESLLDEKNKIDSSVCTVDNTNHFICKRYNCKNKKRKKPKMKKYNYKKGDWQCKNCFNINFHFRTECNKCKRMKY